MTTVINLCDQPSVSLTVRPRFAVLLLLLASTAQAATFLVPSDRELVAASKAIVVATAGESHSRWAPGGWIETVTELRVEEAIKGSITAGKLADYVVMAEDLYSIPVDKIKDVKVLRTVVGGKTVYEG